MITDNSIISNAIDYGDGPAYTLQLWSGACRSQGKCEMATDTFDGDVLVIGSGASGMATAITAASGLTILLVEQMAKQTLGVADRVYVLETGAVTLEGSGRELPADSKVKAAYLVAH